LTAERTDTLAHPAAGRQHYPCAESNPRLWGLPTLAHPLRTGEICKTWWRRNRRRFSPEISAPAF